MPGTIRKKPIPRRLWTGLLIKKSHVTSHRQTARMNTPGGNRTPSPPREQGSCSSPPDNAEQALRRNRRDKAQITDAERNPEDIPRQRIARANQIYNDVTLPLTTAFSSPAKAFCVATLPLCPLERTLLVRRGASSPASLPHPSLRAAPPARCIAMFD
jgi:hypothetical protein